MIGKKLDQFRPAFVSRPVHCGHFSILDGIDVDHIRTAFVSLADNSISATRFWNAEN
jgi:hypothetical protein